MKATKSESRRGKNTKKPAPIRALNPEAADSFSQDMPGECDDWYSKPSKLPQVRNPILARIRATLADKGALHMVILPEAGTPIPKAFHARWFGNNLCEELGTLLLEAIINGDADFVEQLRDAIREANNLFNRGNQSNLLPAFFRYVESLSSPLPTIGKIRSGFEEHTKRELNGSQWKALKQALWLNGHPRGKAGRRSK